MKAEVAALRDQSARTEDAAAWTQAPQGPSAAVWRELDEAATDVAFAAAWLDILRSSISGMMEALVILDGVTIARWRNPSLPPESATADGLAALAELAIRHGRPLLRGRSGAQTLLACPVIVAGAACGAAVIELSPRAEEGLRAATSNLQWGAAWLRDRMRQRRSEAATLKAGRSALALEILAAALDREGFQEASMATVTELATKLNCDRVALGLAKGESVRLVALSHAAAFTRRMALAQQLEAAMLEAVDQRASLIYPPLDPDAPLVLRAHAALSLRNAGGAVVTIPLVVRDRFIGALLAERPARRPFDQPTLDLLAAAGAALAPILEEKRLNDRWLPQKVAATARNQVERLLGPAHLGRKLAVALLLCGLVAIWGVYAVYYVDATARVEGRIERTIVAPFDGFVRTASVRAGDVAREGEPIATLDDRDLLLQRLSWIAERQQRRLEYNRALGSRDRAAANIAQAQIEKAEAQVSLVDDMLGRAKILAPFTGVVVEGDLSRSIGGPVHTGDVLFRLAPLNVYRVALNVDESQIADIATGQTGRLLTSSLPDRPFPITVEKITPVAEARDGRTVFRVEAAVDGGEGLRPGMEGVAKIEIGRRRLAWIWTRSLFDWLALHAWVWLP